MSESVYRLLSRRLDALPNRFPATKSGVELQLLKKLFALEEAALASVMSLVPEPVAAIASRAGVDPKEARNDLKKMAAKGLVDLRRGEGEFAFALKPFVVGFYETQLPRMDEELAALFEQYFSETQGGILREGPALHRVIPVGQAVPFQIEIQPYERANALLEGALSWGVRNCICRVQQRLVGKGCDRPVETCLVFAPVENAFARSTVDRVITKEEAIQILRVTEEAGLVHTAGNYRDGIDYICNCCTCCCGILRGIAEFGIMTAVARSDFSMVAQADACSGCGLCVERCQFNALSTPDGVVVVDYSKCMGCGLCVVVCTTDVLHLERRPSGEMSRTPADISEWRSQRMALQSIPATVSAGVEGGE
jgi:Fe-S-cluster-containing hydrogenase component 2/DNA-binding transcriptional ArsR family regulator